MVVLFFLVHKWVDYSTVNSLGVSYRTAMPPHIMLGHELIHADRAMRGVMHPVGQSESITIVTDRMSFSPLRLISSTRSVRHNISLEELATMGLGHYTAYCITENMIRQEQGLRPRSSYRGNYVWAGN